VSRDPRIDPQPGDELRIGAVIRRVIEREGKELLIQAEDARYWVRVDRWQRWCQLGGAEIAGGGEA
jgi:hypothetical protein